ncbi:inhibitor of growth proteins N-terminal histone-binding-domain-containing protein [Globomyces pollinis-pini]|nr:inhibitor of growth proteins N-terminal histone-binding-domain-containing protein [Globomyces pollinis-pini]
MSSASLAYLEDYLDTFESLPLELTRYLTQLKELDGESHELLTQTTTETPNFLQNIQNLDDDERNKEMLRLVDSFKKLIKHGQDKVTLATQTYDMVERHIRRLDDDLMKFEEEQITGPKLMPSKPQEPKFNFDNPVSNQSRPKRSGDTPKKRKVEELVRDSPPPMSPSASATKDLPSRRSAPITRTSSSRKPESKDISTPKEQDLPEPVVTVPSIVPPVAEDLDIDPNEPTYCICNQVSFGEMIACDNDECTREWFHYACVGLTGPVKGKWFCQDCTALMKN